MTTHKIDITYAILVMLLGLGVLVYTCMTGSIIGALWGGLCIGSAYTQLRWSSQFDLIKKEESS